MTEKKFERFLNYTRREFEEKLKVGDVWQSDLRDFIHWKLDLCTNRFEEERLVETLSEEYRLYLNKLAWNEGE